MKQLLINNFIIYLFFIYLKNAKSFGGMLLGTVIISSLLS